MEKLREFDLLLIKKVFEPVCRFVEQKIGRNQFWQARLCAHLYILAVLVTGGLGLTGGAYEIEHSLSKKIVIAVCLLVLLFIGPFFIYGIRIREEQAQKGDYTNRLHFERAQWPARIFYLVLFSALGVWHFFSTPILVGVIFPIGLQGYVSAHYLLACEPKTPEKKEEKNLNAKPASV